MKSPFLEAPKHKYCQPGETLAVRIYAQQEHRYPMNKPSAENNRWQLNKSVEANIHSYAGMGPKWPWRSSSTPTIYNPILDLPMMHLMAKFGDPSFNPSKVIVQTIPFLADFDRFDPKWPWRSGSNPTIYNPIWDLLMINLMATYGDPSFNPLKVIVRTSPFLADFDSFDPKWPWRSGSNSAIYNPMRDLPKMHVMAKFGNASFNP